MGIVSGFVRAMSGGHLVPPQLRCSAA